jgi:endoglucanase
MKIFSSIAIGVFLVLSFSACSPSKAAQPSTPKPTQAAEPTPTEAPMDQLAFEINQKLGRGINLGNALEAPSEGEWGVTLEEEYFQLIADQGFDSVRIPIRWSAHALPAAPFTITPSFFDRVDWAIENALERGLAVVINFHHYEEIFGDPAGHEERLLAMWTQVAEHYQEAPLELVFEILNEPHNDLTSTRWNDLLVKALAVIRETNPDRIVMIGPGEWNNLYNLSKLRLPENDRKLIATFHYYSPFEFTHQGAEWVDDSDPWLGSSWDGTQVQKSALRADFQIAANWAEENKRPIYLGEFGAYRKADMESRARWTASVARTAEEFGFSWAYWEFCSGFGIYDPQTRLWKPSLVKALIPDN